MPDISIVIASWNAKRHLLKCLKSIGKTATNRSHEIIVVDNASSDGSADAVASQFPEVVLVRNQENLGFAKANNIGIRASSGRYVCLINSDVIVLEGCFENLIEFMDSSPAVGIAGPRILNPDGSPQPQCRHCPTIWNHLCEALGLSKLFPNSVFFSEPFMHWWAHDVVRSVDVLTGCFWIVRRQAIDEVGLLDEDFFIYGEDIDWCKRFHDAGWDVVFCPEPKAIHFGAASSANAPIKFYLEMQKADLHYWKKHHGRIGQISYAMIVLIRHLVRFVAFAPVYLLGRRRRKCVSYKLRQSWACICWVVKYLAHIAV
jgi:GT2 family glycosyltransferase